MGNYPTPTLPTSWLADMIPVNAHSNRSENYFNLRKSNDPKRRLAPVISNDDSLFIPHLAFLVKRRWTITFHAFQITATIRQLGSVSRYALMRQVSRVEITSTWLLNDDVIRGKGARGRAKLAFDILYSSTLEQREYHHHPMPEFQLPTSQKARGVSFDPWARRNIAADTCQVTSIRFRMLRPVK